MFNLGSFENRAPGLCGYKVARPKTIQHPTQRYDRPLSLAICVLVTGNPYHVLNLISVSKQISKQDENTSV